MKKIVLGISLAALAVGGCTKEKHVGEPEMERKFQGDWNAEYFVDNEDMRMRVTEKMTFDTLSHTYRIEQVQKIIYPVNILYSEIEYEGTWTADNERLYGKIDQASVKNELNPNIRNEKQFKVYQDFVNKLADIDLSKDAFMIRVLEPDRIHLIDLDRNVTHDLTRTPVQAEGAVVEKTDSVATDSVK